MTDPIGWKVYRGRTDATCPDEYLGYVPNDGTPGGLAARAEAQYEDLRRQIDDLDETTSV
jgi:hypothetical protein